MSDRHERGSVFGSRPIEVAQVEFRLRELRAMAEHDRLVRQARGPRPLRRGVGRLLIRAGAALAGVPAGHPLPLPRTVTG